MNRVFKPCPFCGGNARLFADERFWSLSNPENRPVWYIKCESCGVRTPTAWKRNVVERWNRRANTVACKLEGKL